MIHILECKNGVEIYQLQLLTLIENDLRNLNIKSNRDEIDKNNYKEYLNKNKLLNNNNKIII